MYNVLVTIITTDTPAPTGVTYASTALVVTDAAGAVQKFSLTAAPWTQSVSGLADGPSTYSAQGVDSTGALMGSPVTGTYTPTPPVTFPAPTGITVTPA